MARDRANPAGAAHASLPPLRGRLGDRLERRARRGEPDAFAQLFRRFHQDIYRYCLAILRDREDAEDALQATMTAALRALPGEERTIELKPWLYRIAHNESVSTLRARRPRVAAEEALEAAPGADLQGELEARERLRVLVADLRSLPERQRGALIMRELSGLSYGEIGAALGMSQGAARQAVYEARTALHRLEEGRAMECESARRAISARDGRRLRGLKLRSHLRSCPDCRAFEAAIGRRGADLEALCPPLAAPLAAGLLTSILGGGGTSGTAAAGAGTAGAGAGAIAGGAGGAGAGAAGGAAAGAGAGLAGAAAIKGASVVAAFAVAAGAAGAGGMIDLPNPLRGGGSEAHTGESAAPAGPASSGSGTAGAHQATPPGHGEQDSDAPGEPQRGSGRNGSRGDRPHPQGKPAAGWTHHDDNGVATGRGHGPPAAPPGQGDSPGTRGRSGDTPAQSRPEHPQSQPSGQPGRSGEAPGSPAEPPARDQAPDQSRVPPQQSQAPTHAEPHDGERRSRQAAEAAIPGT